MNSYICFYKNFRFECDAADMADAKVAALKFFRITVDKAHKIDVRLKQKAAA